MCRITNQRTRRYTPAFLSNSPTLQILDIPLSIAQLSHLQAHPRPLLKLKQLKLPNLEDEQPGEAWNLDIYKVLPEIQVIVYQYILIEALEYLLFKWDLVAPKSVKRLLIDTVEHYGSHEEKDKEKEFYLRAFKDLLGVDLEITCF